MSGRQRLSVHFITEQGLGMEGAGRVDANVICFVGCAEADILFSGLRMQLVVIYEIAEADPSPTGDLAPALNTFEFKNDLCFWQLF